MKHKRQIVICASLDFPVQIAEASAVLIEAGFGVVMPETARLVLEGRLTLAEVLEEKRSGAIVERTVRQDTLRKYYRQIRTADAVLVLNYSKKGVDNYIGGHVLIEMAFAYILEKPILLLNPIPRQLPYADVVEAMRPAVLDGSLQRVSLALGNDAVGEHNGDF